MRRCPRFPDHTAAVPAQSINNNNNNNFTNRVNNKRDSGSNKRGVTMIEIINRLTVLYTISLLSTTILLGYQVILIHILLTYGQYRSNVFTYSMFYFFRIAAIMDATTNCFCLLLQTDSAKPLYNQFCFRCKICTGQPLTNN